MSVPKFSSDYNSFVQTQPPDTIQIIVADPDPLVRRGISGILEQEGDQFVIDHFSDLDQVLSFSTPMHVATVLVDFTLVYDDHYAGLKQLHEAFSNSQIIVMGTVIEPDAVLRAFRIGASGYLPKRGGIREFHSALMQILSGGSPLLPSVAQQLLGHVIQGPTNAVHNTADHGLSPRENEVLECLIDGMCNKEIAVALDVKARTVKAHVSNILRKMDVADRTQAVVKALRSQQQQFF